MRLVSVNVGLPRTLLWKGRTVQTGIFKEPVEGRRIVKRLNLNGDRQADLTVHGGPNKLFMPTRSSHYDFWRDFLKAKILPPGLWARTLQSKE